MSPQPEVLADQLHSAAIHLLRQLRREDDSIGISAPRLSALSVVVFAGPVTLGQLASAEQVKPPTMTRIVTGLEKEGLVERRDDAKDGRLTQIHATNKGRKVLAAGRARRVETLAAAVRSLDTKTRGELACGIEIVERVVSAIASRRVEEHHDTARH
ncbi:MAG TPA: MarR family transcriptional regulator [Thermoanaerobaculia bacterium]